ncbi:MAG: pyridoxal phosphate-dependent aminotransferase, partial [Muribaculaceae bacterium]|nr:pyridoxal phosphate-dependent aminotransferase [Muribaculaceae bacterium]
ELTDRRASGSMKWDSEGDAPDVIQLWVADMDFRTAPAVTEALRRRVDTGIFGYTHVPDSYYEALDRWFTTRHGWSIDRRMVIYTSGVVPAISAIIKAIVAPGEGVILQTPAYNCFFSSVRNNKALRLDNPLIRTDLPAGFTYTIDFEGLEQLVSRPEARMLILCNPHNPTGRVWSRDELERVRDICRSHDVRVVSDEIHCELVHPDATAYIPYATIDDRAIICCSPSKAFNTAGLQIANIVCPDEETRRRVDRAINDNEVCDVNPFGVTALQAAYNDGSDWLDALNEYLYGNYRLLRETFAALLSPLPVCDSESTYLAWIDIRSTGMTADEVARLLLERARVRVSSGSSYGDDHCIRINYATQRERLRLALYRIAGALEEVLKE